MSTFSLYPLDENVQQLRGRCALSLLMPSNISDSDSDDDLSQRSTNNATSSTYSSPRRSTNLKSGCLSPTKSLLSTSPNIKSTTTTATTSSPRRSKRDAFEWQLVGLRVVRGHWALIIERTYETTTETPTPSFNKTTANTNTATTTATTKPATSHEQSNHPPIISPPLGSYKPAAVASPARRNLLDAATTTTIKKQQQMILVLDSVPSEQLLDSNERTWLLRLIRGELGMTTSGRHRPNMLCSLHQDTLTNVQFSSEAVGGEDGKPLQLFAIEPKGVVYVWLWRGDRFRWMWLNRITLDRDHYLDESNYFINHAVYLADEKLLVWSITNGNGDDAVVVNNSAVKEETIKETEETKQTNGITKESNETAELLETTELLETDHVRNITTYGTRACKVYLVRRAQQQTSAAAPPPPQQQQQQPLNNASTTTPPIIKRLLTMVVGQTLQFDEIPSQARQHMCCTSSGIWSLDQLEKSSPLVLSVWSGKSGRLSVPFAFNITILGCCQDQINHGALLLLDNNLDVMQFNVALQHSHGASHQITTLKLCTLKLNNPKKKEEDEDGVVSFVSQGHSLIVLSSSNQCQIYDRGTGLLMTSLTIPSHQHGDASLNNIPRRLGTWSLNRSFGHSGILTEYGIWTLIPPDLFAYGKMLIHAAATFRSKSITNATNSSNTLNTLNDAVISQRLIAMAEMHGPSGERLAAHYRLFLALDSNEIEASDQLWSSVNDSSLQNPTLPLASRAQDPGITFASKMIHGFFDQHQQVENEERKDEGGSSTSSTATTSGIARMTLLNMSMMNDLTEMKHVIEESRNTLNAFVIGEDDEDDDANEDTRTTTITANEKDNNNNTNTNTNTNNDVSFFSPWMEIDALMSNAESMQSLRTLEASLGLKEGEGIDGILWPPSHPLLAPEVLPTDAVSSSSFFLSSSNESSIDSSMNTNTNTNTTINSNTNNDIGSISSIAMIPSSNTASSHVSSHASNHASSLQSYYTNRLFERLCRLYHRHLPRALTRFVELVEEQYARTMGTAVRGGDTWSGPVARRACQCLPLLPSPDDVDAYNSNSNFHPEPNAMNNDETDETDETDENDGFALNRNIQSVRLEARAWLLLVSGETVLAVRTLLTRCDWETAIAFCEHVFKKEKEDKEKRKENRVQTLLFEEILTYCLSTHGPPEMLLRVFPLIPNGYTLDQLLACIAPYETNQNVLNSEGSAASFGAVRVLIEKLTKERYGL